MIRGRMSQARLAFEDCHSAAHYLNGTKEGGVEKDPTGVCGRPVWKGPFAPEEGVAIKL